MKKVLFVLGLTLAGFAPSAHAGLGFDGCYQLYLPNTMFPALCLEGTAEEGINGAGVRLVIFRTNTDRVAHCSKSSASGMSANSFEYFLNGKKEFSFDNVTTKDGLKQGDATFGGTHLKFVQLYDAHFTRLM